MSAPTRSEQQRQAQEQALRRRQLQQTKAIKACQRQLGMDDDTYRAVLHKLTGQRSATQLNLQQGGRVLDYLRRQGAVNPKAADRNAGQRRPMAAPERAPMLEKVHALLRELGTVTGEEHTLAYADAICRRNGWASSVSFAGLDALHALIGALSRTLRSKQGRAAMPTQAR